MSDDLFAERLLRVIDEGQRTATYKLALLLGLMDCVAASPGVDMISTRAIAERVLSFYYPQSREYVAADGMAQELRQITNESSPVLRAALGLRLFGESKGCRSVVEVRDRHFDQYDQAVGEIENTFVRYPIKLLQEVGGKSIPFLYDPDVHRVDGQRFVQLFAGVGDRLVSFGPLIRPLIELHWARDVAKITRLETEDERLRVHLFGTNRVQFPSSLRDGLVEIQNNECFYCGDRLRSGVEVDHFLAWSRWPNDAIENLVLADKCNSYKSDHLVAAQHIDRWVARTVTNREQLSDVARVNRWESDPVRTKGLITSTYSHVAPGLPLWVHGTDFELASGPIRLD